MGCGDVGNARWRVVHISTASNRYLRMLLVIGALSVIRRASGNIIYTMHENTMILNFRWQSYWDEDWQSVEQTIWFSRTHCNYGGQRKWFLCPHCNKRVAILYGADVRFLCRHCYRLPYASQGENYFDRMERKANKINLQLDPDGLDDDYYNKPKGMHWKTFNRLISVNNTLQEAIERGFLYKFRHWL